ncbi:MAG: NfeD family protein [Planctomycetota bacterium]
MRITIRRPRNHAETWIRVAMAVLLGWFGGSLSSAQPDGQTPRAVPAARQADRVAVISIQDEINAVTATSVKRRMQQAADAGAQAIVFDINTPGGEVTAVLEITAAIKSSPIANTVAWINPEAYSGGAIIGLACREIVVSESSSFGDALPIAIGLGGAQAATQGDLRKKVVPPVLADVVDSARLRGWDEFLVQAIVIDGVELWLVERDDPAGGTRLLAINEAEFRLLFPDQEPPRGAPLVIAANTASQSAPVGETAPPPAAPRDGNAFRPASPTLDSLSPDLSGEADENTARDLDMLASSSQRPVLGPDDIGDWRLAGYLTNGSGPIVMKSREMLRLRFATTTVRNDEELRAFFGASELLRLDRSWSEAAVSVLSKFWVRGLLIVIFLLAMFLEMTSPGLFAPGVVALTALVLLMAPAWMLGLAGWWEVVAIGIGITLILAEILVLPGFGVFGVAGLIALFAGLVGSFVGPSGGLFPSDSGQQAELVRALITVVLAMLTSAAGMAFIVKQFGRLPVIGKLVLDANRDDGDQDDIAPTAELFAAIDDRDELERLVGAEGTAHTALMPSGRIEIDGELYDGKCEFGYLDQSDPVRVLRTDAWQLVVERSGPDQIRGGEPA